MQARMGSIQNTSDALTMSDPSSAERFTLGGALGDSFDVSPDGTRFLMIREPAPPRKPKSSSFQSIHAGFVPSRVEKSGGLSPTRRTIGNCSLSPNYWYYAVFMLPDEQLSPEQVTALRTMSGEKRLHLAEQLYWAARRIKAAGVRSQHPDWHEDRVAAEVSRIFLNAQS